MALFSVSSPLRLQKKALIQRDALSMVDDIVDGVDDGRGVCFCVFGVSLRSRAISRVFQVCFIFRADVSQRIWEYATHLVKFDVPSFPHGVAGDGRRGAWGSAVLGSSVQGCGLPQRPATMTFVTPYRQLKGPRSCR